MRRVRGHLKIPDPKKKADGCRNYPTHGLHLFPRIPLPQLLFKQCPENPLGALKWKNVSILGLSTQHQITRSLLTSVQCCPFHKHTFTTGYTIHVYGLLLSIVAFQPNS